MTTVLVLLLLIAGFTALVSYVRHDRFAPRSPGTTLFGQAGRAAHHPNLVPR